jgi:hypothetical protein
VEEIDADHEDGHDSGGNVEDVENVEDDGNVEDVGADGMLQIILHEEELSNEAEGLRS